MRELKNRNVSEIKNIIQSQGVRVMSQEFPKEADAIQQGGARYPRGANTLNRQAVSVSGRSCSERTKPMRKLKIRFAGERGLIDAAQQVRNCVIAQVPKGVIEPLIESLAEYIASGFLRGEFDLTIVGNTMADVLSTVHEESRYEHLFCPNAMGTAIAFFWTEQKNQTEACEELALRVPNFLEEFERRQRAASERQRVRSAQIKLIVGCGAAFLNSGDLGYGAAHAALLNAGPELGQVYGLALQMVGTLLVERRQDIRTGNALRQYGLGFGVGVETPSIFNRRLWRL